MMCINQPVAKLGDLQRVACRITAMSATTHMLHLNLQVTLHGDALAGASDMVQDKVVIQHDNGEYELVLRGVFPKPAVQIVGDLMYGLVPNESKATKSFKLINTGLAPAKFKLDWDRWEGVVRRSCRGRRLSNTVCAARRRWFRLHAVLVMHAHELVSQHMHAPTASLRRAFQLAITPTSGEIPPAAVAGVPGPESEVEVSVSLTVQDLGTVGGDISVILGDAGTDVRRVAFSATSVKQGFEVMDGRSTSLIQEVDFGTHYFGETVERTITLFNNGPLETRYRLRCMGAWGPGPMHGFIVTPGLGVCPPALHKCLVPRTCDSSGADVMTCETC